LDDYEDHYNEVSSVLRCSTLPGTVTMRPRQLINLTNELSVEPLIC